MGGAILRYLHTVHVIVVWSNNNEMPIPLQKTE